MVFQGLLLKCMHDRYNAVAFEAPTWFDYRQILKLDSGRFDGQMNQHF